MKSQNARVFTKAGEIPVDWHFARIGEVSHIVTNGFVGTVTPYYTQDDSGVTYIQGFNVRENRIDLRNVEKVSAEFSSKHSKSILREGDMLTVQSGHIGTTAVVTKDLQGANCHAVIITRFHKEIADSNYIAYYLNSDFGRSRLKGLEVGSSVLHINTKELRKFCIPIPPLTEQRKIAQIISDWDKSISLVQREIIGKQRFRKELAQVLLTGKKRFPEFIQSLGHRETTYGRLPLDWQYISIANIAHQVSTKNFAAKDLPVLSCTKHYGLVDSLEYFGRRMFSKDTSTYKLVRRGQFAYATNHIEEGSIGYQDLHNEALISPMYTVFETNALVEDGFLYKVLKTELYRHIFEVQTSASVNRRGSLRWNAFSHIKVPLPSLAEQKKIAELLSNLQKVL